MRPRTKLQALVYGLSVNLPNLTQVQKQWAYKNCLLHIGYRTKKVISCLDCGHVWPGPQAVKTCDCPECGVKLKIEDTRKKKLDQVAYPALLDAKEGFQITRFFQIYSYHRAGEKPRFHIWEIVQHWMHPDHKLEIIARNRAYNWSTVSFHGDLEIRDRQTIHTKYDLYIDRLFPKSKCLSIYKRNGVSGTMKYIRPYSIFKNILTDTKAETLLKSKQFDLLDARVGNRRAAIDRYWDSVKICIRNNYLVKDSTTWLDYLDLLRHFNRDLRSPKFVCPADLKQAHDKLVAKKREVERRQSEERMRKRVESDQKDYLEAKQAYFGIVFSKGDLTVKVMESVREFMQEGDTHKHCVFTNQYYNKKDSLVFSARIAGRPIETIEVSLSAMKVIQSRGLGNKASEYNQQIVELLTKNMGVIKQKHRTVKNVAA